MSDTFSAPTPGFEPAYRIDGIFGEPLPVGAIATGGRRSYVPVVGGRFSGEGLEGKLVGGGETLLERANGVVVVEVSFYIAFADGAIVRCFGNGYRTGADDRAAPGFRGLRAALLFEAGEDGPLAALATRAFMLEQADGDPVMRIDRIV